ncbi:MAG: presenilin family intramembrane aspartyl protease [Candidatus Nanohaloarchaeota archaeon QJJ-7]|nr:presenilin family intramembrane aspartyl protease [Candidatus Nanohaloarchaeota archaeon QJJ-7]
MDVDDTSYVLLGLFLAANLLGLSAGIRLYTAPAVQQVSSSYQGPVSGAAFFVLMMVATGILLLLYRLKNELVVKIWFNSALVITALMFFDAFLPSIAALAFALVLIGARYRTGSFLVRNLSDVIPFAGAGAFFGVVLGLRAAIVLFALLAVYDYIAVNRTGHMVKLAEQGIESGTMMGFQYPKEEIGDRPVSGERMEKSGDKVGMLGGGDVIMPMMLAVSIVPVFGPAAAVSTIAGAATALFVFLTVIQQRDTERFYPAIPVVGSGALFGLVLHLALSLL